MADIYANARSTTGTRTRVTDINPTSGMCPICIRNCQTLCEIGLSAFRGREVLYPSPEVFGESTSASNKDYALDWSHFQILVDVLGAKGIEADPDKAIFEAVDIKTEVGGVPLKIPVLTAGLGSTAVAKKNWDSLAIGAGINWNNTSHRRERMWDGPCIKDHWGKVVHSEDLQYRVEKYREFWDGKHGDIVVQTNVEDQRLGVDTYALSKLGVNIIERKWGQGAKAIGGEVRIHDIGKAKMLKQRGYIVLPDPEDISVQEAFRAGVFRSFERHSRVGMPEQRSFVEDVEWLRGQGAKKVFLKTGAYRPSVVAFTMKVASEAKIDVVTFDGAGGGTGMSPVPMMNECSTPTVYLEAQVLKCMELLMSKGRYVPDIVMAGGFVNETQMFKSMAMSNLGNGPCVKAIAMARAPITAALKASYFTELAVKGELPQAFAKKYGETPEQFFIATPELKSEFGDNFQDIPVGAIGVYTYYYSRLGVGLKQLLAATRKWRLDLIDRGDIASLSDRASKVTLIPTIEEIENDVMASILS